MRNKQNSELHLQRTTKQRHHQTRRSLKKQKRAAHKEDRVTCRAYLRSCMQYDVWTEVV